MTSKDIQLSKSLSWLLRHGAVKEGLKLSPEGYIDISKILQHKSFKQYSHSDIERVVQNNDKKRFSLRQNPLTHLVEIKANQGHSINSVTDAELTPILTAKYGTIVHGTYTKCWPQIKQTGLSRMQRLHIHLAKGTTTDHSVISGLRNNAQIHIYVNLRKALEDGIKFYESENGVILTPGNDKGFLETKYFDRVVEVATGWRPPLVSMEAPLALVPAPARPPVARPAFPARPAQATRPAAQTIRPAAQPTRPPHAPRAAGRTPAAGAHAQRDYRPPPRQEPDRVLPTSILVTGYPPYTKPQDLAHVFCQFGDVRLNYDWITDTAACLEFGTPDQAKAAISASRTVNIYGAFLTVKQCTVNTTPHRQARRREQRIKQNCKGTIVEPTSIPLQGTFQQQLEALLRCVRLSQAELERLNVLYADIEAVLGSIWPGCRAYPFGSVTTGLGVKSSDADCFVLLPDANQVPNAVPRARRLLQQHPQVFAELLAIPRANTPIVKFLHLPTRVYCDLSFKTMLGSRNSKLIAFLLFSDPRLVPLAVVVKYWARVHDLSGTGKITNYALTMLIIFYLQQPPRHILPAVRWLQRDRADAYYVDYWNTGFMSDSRRLPRVTDESSVAELLGGFFHFYSEFNFEQYAVCPFLGRQIPKNDFRDFDRLPDEFALYKNNVAQGYSMPLRFMSPMCVQDPFEQCHNVASPVTPRLAADVTAFFKFAADAYETEKSKDCAGFLRTILMQKPKLIRGRTRGSYRVKLPAVMIGSVVAADWKAAVRDVTMQVFGNVLKIQLEKDDGETEANRKVSKTEEKENAKPEKNKSEKGTPKKEAKKTAKAQTTEAVKTEINEAVESEPIETVEPEAEETPKPVVNGIDTQEVMETDKPDSKDIPKPEATGAAKKNAKGASKQQGGITRKEKEAYKGELTRAIWKRKTFTKLYNVMSLKFLDREAMITDEILNTDKNVITCGFRVGLTFNNAPRGAVVTLKYDSGETHDFKEFAKFFTSNFNHWFIAMFKPFCKEGPNNKAYHAVNEAQNKEDDSDTDSDTDSYEDERIPGTKNHAKHKHNKDESRGDDDSIMSTVIDNKNNKDKTNDSVKMFFNSILSNANKIKSNENKPVDQKNDKDEKPSEKSPRKTKNRSPKHKKGKEKIDSDAGESSGNSKSAVENDQTP